MKKAVIDIRISDDKQIGNTSLGSQETISRNYCDVEGYEVWDVRRNEAVSANETNIQRVAELLEYCKINKGNFEVYVVFKLDRFARSQEQHHWLRGQLMKLGIILRSATERIDESPSGRLVEGVLAAVNEYDNEVRKERAKIAMWRRVEQGLWPWQPPTGYLRHVVPSVRLSVSEWDQSCCQAVLDIFKFYSTGVYTFTSLASLMKSKRVITWQGRKIKFSKQLIQNMLNNSFYVGMLKGKDGKYTKGQHVALVDVPLWNKCQEIIKQKSNHAVNKRVRNNPDFPLRRFVQCEVCSRPFTGGWSRSENGGRHPYYYCNNKSCERYCKTIKQNDLHTFFYEYLKQVKPKEGLVEKFKEVFIKRYQKRIGEIKGEYLAKLEEIKQLEKDQLWLVESGKKGIIPEALLKTQLDDSERKITLAKLNLTETHVEELEIDALLSYGLTFIQTPELIWEDALSDAKTKYQKMIFPSGVLYGESGFSNSEISLAFKVIEDFAVAQSKVVPSGRIERPSQPSQGRILSVELRGHFKTFQSVTELYQLL